MINGFAIAVLNNSAIVVHLGFDLSGNKLLPDFIRP